jgi:hypothetical protein
MLIKIIQSKIFNNPNEKTEKKKMYLFVYFNYYFKYFNLNKVKIGIKLLN